MGTSTISRSRRRFGAGALVSGVVIALLAALSPSSALALTDPTDSTTVIRVRLADVRVAAGLGTDDVDARYAEGQTLVLATDEAGTQPLSDAWATCVADADGICEFVVPDTQAGGANEGIVPWIVFGDPVAGSPAANNTYVVESFYTSNRTGARGQIPYSIQVPSGAVTASALVELPEAVDPAADVDLAQRDTFGNLGLSVNNPALTTQCRPLQVALVFDLSSSIGAANLPLVKEAGRVLVDGLLGSGSSVGLYTFSRYAPSSGTTSFPLTSVDAPGGRDALVSEIDGYVTSSGTNWDRGIAQVAEDAPDYDIAFVLTDGLPDKSGFPYMPASSTFPQRFAEVDQGRYSANALKEEGTRIFGIGINLDEATSVPSLPETSIQAISGLSEYPDVPAIDADYASADWDRLVALTSELVDEIVCRTDITVHKTEISRDGVESPGSEWEFGISSSAPEAVITPDPSVLTDASGTATASITTPGTAPADVSITETPKAGWEFSEVRCTVDGTPVVVPQSPDVTLPQVAPESQVECFFVNRDARVDSTLTLHKVEEAGTGARPGQGWGFEVGAAGEGIEVTPTGALTTDESGTASAVITTPDDPFDVTVDEITQPGWTLADVSCTIDGAPVDVEQVPGIAIADVPPGSEIDCVFVNAEDPVTSTITIEKRELLDGVETPGDGWVFDLASTGAEFDPDGPLTTGDDGMATANITTPNAPFDLAVSERAQGGWVLDRVTCTVDGEPVDVEQSTRISLAAVDPGAQIACVFVNTDDPEVPGQPGEPDGGTGGGGGAGGGDAGSDPGPDRLGITGGEPAGLIIGLGGTLLVLGAAALLLARNRAGRGRRHP